MKYRSEWILASSILITLLFGEAFVRPSSTTGATREEEIARAAESLRSKLVEQRRDFHMHPELSNREERTSRVIAEKLRALGLDEVKTGVGKHGVVGLLKGKLPGGPNSVVAVRADMDALPIQETIDVPYKSRNDGVKHACGHDAHMTVQLGVAELLSKMRDHIRGSIKFIFQPAEEGAPLGERGGAKYMIEEWLPRESAPVRYLWIACDAEYRGRQDRLQLRPFDGLVGSVLDNHSRQKGPRRLPARWRRHGCRRGGMRYRASNYSKPPNQYPGAAGHHTRQHSRWQPVQHHR